MYDYFFFYEDNVQYLENLENLKKNITKINNERVFIATKKSRRFEIIKKKNVFYFFFNENNDYLDLLISSLEVKKKRPLIYKKYKRFVLFYYCLAQIKEKFDIQYLINLHRSFQIIKEIDNKFKNFINSNYLISYIDRSSVYYLDDTNFIIFNFKHEFIKKYLNFVIENIKSHIYVNEAETSLDFLFTKSRYHFQNKFDAFLFKNYSDPYKIIKNDILNFFQHTFFSDYFLENKKHYQLAKKIVESRNIKLLKKKLDFNKIYSDLDLEGLFNKNVICTDENIKKNMEFLYNNIQFEKMNLEDLNNKSNLKNKLIYLDLYTLYNTAYEKLFSNLLSLENKIIIKKTIFFNKKNQFTKLDNLFDDFIKKDKKVIAKKNIKSQIFILNENNSNK